MLFPEQKSLDQSASQPFLQTVTGLPSKGWESGLGVLIFPLCTTQETLTHAPQYTICEYLHIYVCYFHDKTRIGAGGKDQWVETLATKPVELKSTPGTHGVGENYKLPFDPCPCAVSYIHPTHTQIHINIYTHMHK